MSYKYYAVKRGNKTGIYTSWPQTQKQVTGFSRPVFKGFQTKEEAEQFMIADNKKTLKKKSKKKNATRPQKTNRKSNIVLFSDGGCRNSGNKLGEHVKKDDLAAWAYLVKIKNSHKEYSNAGGTRGVTNSKMEVTGFIKGLQFLINADLNKKQIDAYLDSKYVINSIKNGWMSGWKSRGWKKSNGDTIKNKSEFILLDSLLSQFSNLEVHWVKGHAKNEGNNFVDRKLNEAMDQLSKENKG